MKNIIDLNGVKIGAERWKVIEQDSDKIGLIRVGRHLIYPDRDKWGRWITIPFQMTLKERNRYSLSFKVLCNYKKISVPVYLLNKENEISTILNFSVNENILSDLSVEFVCDIPNANRIMFTATDFPISGEVLQLSGIKIFSI